MRTVEPCGLSQQGGRWFLAAYCSLREGLRLFRVDRSETATLLNETFERPDDLDLATFVRRSAAIFPGAVPTWGEAVMWLGVPPEALKPWWGEAAFAAEAGGTRLCARVGDLEGFALLLLHLSARHGGCALEARSPPELKDAFQKLAERIQGMLGGAERATQTA